MKRKFVMLLLGVFFISNVVAINESAHAVERPQLIGVAAFIGFVRDCNVAPCTPYSVIGVSNVYDGFAETSFAAVVPYNVGFINGLDVAVDQNNNVHLVYDVQMPNSSSLIYQALPKGQVPGFSTTLPVLANATKARAAITIDSNNDVYIGTLSGILNVLTTLDVLKISSSGGFTNHNIFTAPGAVYPGAVNFNGSLNITTDNNGIVDVSLSQVSSSTGYNEAHAHRIDMNTGSVLTPPGPVSGSLSVFGGEDNKRTVVYSNNVDMAGNAFAAFEDAVSGNLVFAENRTNLGFWSQTQNLMYKSVSTSVLPDFFGTQAPTLAVATISSNEKDLGVQISTDAGGSWPIQFTFYTSPQKVFWVTQPKIYDQGNQLFIAFSEGSGPHPNTATTLKTFLLDSTSQGRLIDVPTNVGGYQIRAINHISSDLYY